MAKDVSSPSGVGTRVPKCSDLKSIGIAGSKACNCCREMVLRSSLAYQAVDQFIAELQSDENAEGKTDLYFALVPITAPVGPIVEPLPFPETRTPKPLRLPRGVRPAGGVFIVVALGAEVLVSLSSQLTALAVLATVQEALRTVTERQARDAGKNCANCVAANSWRQSNRQTRKVGEFRTRK